VFEKKINISIVEIAFIEKTFMKTDSLLSKQKISNIVKK